MDGTVLRYWPKAFGGALALLLLASLVSFDLQDPTLTNLRLPSGGIANLLGLPGALVGGSLLELLGSASLLAPLLWLNYALCARNRPPLHRYAVWSALLLVALSGLHGLAVAPVQPGLDDPGLAGWAMRHWAGLTLGPWASAAVLAFLVAAALPRIAYAPLVHAARRDAALFARWLLRGTWRRWHAGWRAMRHRATRMGRVTGAVALGLRRQARLGVADGVQAMLAAPRALFAWLGEVRRPSLARIKHRAPGTAAEAVAARVQPAGGDDAGADDPFDHWFEQPGWSEPAPVAPAGAAPEPPPQSTRRAPPPEPAPDDAPEPAPAAAAEGDPFAALLRGATAAPPPMAEAEPAAAMDDAAAVDATDGDAPPGVDGTPITYRFEQPEAEAAWRERFQRYARNLDLDWEEQLWRRQEDEPAAEGEAGEGDG